MGSWGVQAKASYLVFSLGLLGVSYKVICRWLLLVLGLGPFNKRYRLLGSAVAPLSGFRKV